jgi:hypothetical protein
VCTTRSARDCRIFDWFVSAKRLEDRVNPAALPKHFGQTCGLHVMGTEIIENCAVVIEQGLDVEQFERPDAIFEDLNARVEAPQPIELVSARAFQIVGTRGS